MVTESEQALRSSIHVAPLFINKDRSRARSASAQRTNASSRTSHRTQDSTSSLEKTQMTPPTTPNGSQEDLNQIVEAPQPVFHSFLRAFYPFHPTYAVSDTTVTLPLNEGDVILVHSIHTNGWADGTLLVSGARGWLPTNYCDGYNPEPMQSLLKALLHFWDLLRSGMVSDNEIFSDQEFMRGIIAGVRYLLEKSNCLTRESMLIQTNEGLRRNRKALLSDLSALVKTGKRLQECAATSLPHADIINSTVDEMILKAFKIVTRGIRFLDVWEDDLRTRQVPIHRHMATVAEEANNPPTPPAESTSFEATQQTDPASDMASRRTSSQSSGTGFSMSQRSDEQTKRMSYKRTSTAYSSTASSRPLSLSRPPSVQIKRNSISHRLSASIPSAQRQNLVSEKLNASHDILLSHLASFIGRLHVQSQSPTDLIVAVGQSVAAGRELLTVVDVLCAHDNLSAESLNATRNALDEKIQLMVNAAQDIMKGSRFNDEDLVMPYQKTRLMTASTGCVKAAGECVAKTKFVIERIGDFEFEPHSEGLGIDVQSMGTSVVEVSQPSEPEPIEEAAVPQPASRPPPPPLIIPSYEKPLPEVPLASPPLAEETNPISIAPITVIDPKESAPATTKRTSLLPPLPKMTSPLLSHDDYSPSDNSSGHDGEFQSSFRSTSIAISSSGTSSTYLSSMRDSESSIISQTSTRATTPDHSVNYTPKNQPSLSDISVTESQSTLAEDAEDGESKILEKTFAHELVHNKEGQITGGTLQALVERLTTHASTPDSMFVSTFYLTFRLFVTPVDLAKALVERFDYVAESPQIAGPVRLRVYNRFKGWLESHWRDLSDHDALAVIEPFAKDKLGKVLPAAGRRLLELAQKVSSTDRPLVPRLVSSMGKTSTSIAQYIPADTPLPPLNLSKSSVAVLKNWKMGGSNPTILDFDPLELARQLTIKGMNIFCSILPEELLGSEWTKRSGSNAVNVRAMSTLSTDLSNLVADTILQYDDVKKRAVIIKHWIKIAQKCFELNNYDSLMAIICSLNSSTITRLKRTWDIVSQKRRDMLQALQAMVEPDKNYAVLRRRLHDHVPPCLPFVGMYLTDLTFVDAGNSATRILPGLGDSDGISVINYDKHTRTAKIIGELQRFQIPYRLAEVPELQEWIQAQIVRVKSTENENVQTYYRKSLLLEPRETTHTRNGSPVEGHGSFSSKERFDLFSWTHSRERANSVVPPTPI